LGRRRRTPAKSHPPPASNDKQLREAEFAALDHLARRIVAVAGTLPRGEPDITWTPIEVLYGSLTTTASRAPFTDWYETVVNAQDALSLGWRSCDAVSAKSGHTFAQRRHSGQKSRARCPPCSNRCSRGSKPCPGPSDNGEAASRCDEASRPMQNV
jgi:hypothetical protein